MSPHICHTHARSEAHPAALSPAPTQGPVGSRTVTGALTVTTFPSSMSSSRALWQSSRTSASGIGRHARSWAMALAGSVLVSAFRFRHAQDGRGDWQAHSPVEVAHDGGLWWEAVCVRVCVCVCARVDMPSRGGGISWEGLTATGEQEAAAGRKGLFRG